MKRYLGELSAVFIALGSICVQPAHAAPSGNFQFAVVPMISKVKNTHDDTTNVFFRTLSGAVNELSARYELKWNGIDVDLYGRLKRALLISARNGEETFDSLPYAVWDVCDSKGIDYLIVFYIFHDDDEIVSSMVSSYVAPFGKSGGRELSDENINYYVNVVDVKSNRSILNYDQDIDDLLEWSKDKTPSGAARRFVGIAGKKIDKLDFRLRLK